MVAPFFGWQAVYVLDRAWQGDYKIGLDEDRLPRTATGLAPGESTTLPAAGHVRM